MKFSEEDDLRGHTKITQQIEQTNQDDKVPQVGTVVQVEDGIALIFGLDQVIVGDLIGFEEGGTVGIAQDLKEGIVRVALTGEAHNVQEGSQVILERKRPGRLYGEEHYKEPR